MPEEREEIIDGEEAFKEMVKVEKVGGMKYEV